MTTTKIPFPTVILAPLKLDDMRILDLLSNDVCSPFIKIEIVKHIYYFNRACKPGFPVEPKEFYIVPFRENETFKDFNLKLPDFASLFLPSVALHRAKIRENAPKNLKESPIIALDDHFSFFGEKKEVLVVDLSFEDTRFLFWENQRKKFDPTCQFLAEARS